MVQAKKQFGQNFLIDQGVINSIISSFSPSPNDSVLEIGPGHGALTFPLLETLDSINIVEIDRDLISKYKSLNSPKINIYESDILKFDLDQLPKPLRIIGNLPYNISSPILFHILKRKENIKDMLFMFQYEVAERITAKPNSKAFGRLSVMTQTFFDTEILIHVPPLSFEPAPKIDSAVVYFKPKLNFELKNFVKFEELVKLSFSQRRKKLKNCLKSLLTQDDTAIDLSLRAEQLEINDYLTLLKDYERLN